MSFGIGNEIFLSTSKRIFSIDENDRQSSRAGEAIGEREVAISSRKQNQTHRGRYHQCNVQPKHPIFPDAPRGVRNIQLVIHAAGNTPILIVMAIPTWNPMNRTTATSLDGTKGMKPKSNGSAQNSIHQEIRVSTHTQSKLRNNDEVARSHCEKGSRLNPKLLRTRRMADTI